MGNSQYRAAAQSCLGTDRCWRQQKLVPLAFASACFNDLHQHVLEVRVEVRRSEQLHGQMGPV